MMKSVLTSLSTVSLLLLHPTKSFADDSSYKRSESKQEYSTPSGSFHRNSYTEAYEIAAPSVVNVQCSSSQFPSLYRVSGSGSGFIISESGRIVTNCHVVQHCQTAPLITLGDNQQFRASVIGVDQATDLALLQIITSEGKNQAFPVAKLGDSDRLKPGTLVMALGSPLSLSKTATHGIISAVERHCGELGLSASHRTGYIQTDVPINMGNSGGPLIDLDGSVVGVTTLRATNASGISFAVPIKTVKSVVEQLNQFGHVTRPYIGIFMLTLTPAIISREHQTDPNFPDVKFGVLVTSVSPHSPAAIAGLRPGDVIVSVNFDIPIETAQTLTDYLGFDYKRAIVLQVLRGRNQHLDISIKPVARGDV